MSKSAKKQRYHHGDLRRALLDAALDLVNEKGPNDFSLREAARRAGVSSGAPYKHFPDKHALMTALATEAVELLQTQMIAAMKEAGDGLEKYRAIGVTYVTFAVQHPAHFRVMSIPEYADPESSAALAEAVASHHEEVRSVIENARDQGAIVDADTDVIQLAAQALVYGLARMFVDGHLARFGLGPESATDVAMAVTDILGRGLIPRDDDC